MPTGNWQNHSATLALDLRVPSIFLVVCLVAYMFGRMSLPQFEDISEA